MNDTLLLFELPEQKYKPFPDPYTLKGQEKKDALDSMVEFTIKYQGLDNPTQANKRQFFSACQYLERDAIRQETRIHLSVIMYHKMQKNLVDAELEAYQINVKLRFMEKYQKVGALTPELSKELDKITKMEKVACYQINGVDITMRDCDVCKSKICQRKPKTEEEWDAIREAR